MDGRDELEAELEATVIRLQVRLRELRRGEPPRAIAAHVVAILAESEYYVQCLGEDL